MRLHRILLFVIVLVLVVGIAQAKIIKGGANDGALIIPKISTSLAPTIGNYTKDQIWNLVDATWMQYVLPQNGSYPTDWSDCSGWAKFLYDGTKIYGLFYVQDDVIDTVTTIDWQMDGIEFYIDANNTHTSQTTVVGRGADATNPPTSRAYQFNLRPAQPIDSVMNVLTYADHIGKGLQYKWMLDTSSISNGGPSGYFVEFSFNLDSLGLGSVAVGKKVSLQLQIDDNDVTPTAAGSRIHILNWNSSTQNTDYQATVGWGDAVFGDLIDTNYVFLKTPTPPALDGTIDNVWQQANQLTMDYITNSSGVTSGANPQDQGWRFYGLYDNQYIYGLFTVYDDVIDTVTAIDWQMDGIEFFTDANHTHTSTTTVVGRGADATNPPTSRAYQFNLRPAQPRDSVMNVLTYADHIGKGLQYNWKLFNQGLENDTMFNSRSGYRVAFKFNLDSLGFTTADRTSGTKVFSFQLQTDDNDITPTAAGSRIHTSNWWYSPSNNDYQVTANWGNAILSSTAITVGVKQQPSSVVSSYKLDQNYPNPFNPSTEISFTLVKSEKVRLAVYNLLGEEVAVLVNGMRNAGPQAVTFNAKNLSSGVYFYKLEAGSTVLAKKMMLLK
ncbi:MAG: sugar-binding protein [Bacteroidota bacterium]|jgi:hypothetical protein